jgi:lysocardiolipin and lysophospholipid acyltransferase
MSSWLVGFALLFPTALVEYLLFTRIRLFCPPSATAHLLSAHPNSSLMISNHPTTGDWLFLFSLFPRLPCFDLSALRITMKSELRQAPGLGWALSQIANLFLDRKWEVDQKNIQQFIDFHIGSLDSISFPISLLLFPEGTDLSNPKGQTNSLKFAQQHQLPVYHYVLHPRTTGFVEIWKLIKIQKLLRKNEQKRENTGRKVVKAQAFNSIIDVTIAFPTKQFTKVEHIVAGNFPEEIHFFLDLCASSTLDELSSPQIEQWIKERYLIKENLLKRFYQTSGTKRFVDDQGRPATEIPFDSVSVHRAVLISAFIFWFCFILACLVALVESSQSRILLVSSWIWYGGITKFFGGFDRFLFHYDAISKRSDTNKKNL